MRLARVVAATAVALAATTAAQHPAGKGTMMPDHVASGTFVVKLTPSGAPGDPVGAMAIAKTFHGDLDGSSVGQMLAVRTATEGSAGYVAMERVTATLAGRHGSFALQHSGTMNKGAQSLSVTVVPDSGTDQLAGLSGSMDIDVRDGQHFYAFHYRLAATQRP